MHFLANYNLPVLSLLLTLFITIICLTLWYYLSILSRVIKLPQKYVLQNLKVIQSLIKQVSPCNILYSVIGVFRVFRWVLEYACQLHSSTLTWPANSRYFKSNVPPNLDARAPNARCKCSVYPDLQNNKWTFPIHEYRLLNISNTPSSIVLALLAFYPDSEMLLAASALHFGFNENYVWN